jgi:hypothetical protein
MKKLAAILLLSALPAFGTTAVAGHLSTLSTGSATSATHAFVRFWLRGCRENQPRITGTGAIAPEHNADSVFYVDLPADGSGNVSGTIYATRDAAGTGNGEIECGGSYTAVWYGMQIFNNGIAGPEIPVHAKNGATLDPANITPITSQPVPAAGTGDTTYLRLDGGNSPITGAVTMLGNNTLSGANLLSVKRLNSVRYADQFAGASPDAKITAAMADCPTTGCVVDATGFLGAITFAAGVIMPSDRAVQLLLGNVTITGPCPLFDGSKAADKTALLGTGTGDSAFRGVGHGGTRLVCSLGADGIKFGSGSPRISGVRIENLGIDCNNVAARGLTLDTIEYSTFRNLIASNCTVAGFENKATSAGASNNIAFNRYDQLSSTGSPVCLQADSNPGLTSVWTQNTVTMLQCNFSGKGGVVLNGADNNWFYGIQTYRDGGSGYGVVLAGPGSSNFGAWTNHFFGLIGGVAGVSAMQVQDGTMGNEVYGYDTINGELLPTLLGSAELLFEGSVRCGPSGCPGSSGTHPTPWIYAQGNAGNIPSSNPTPLVAGCALAWNWSNGGGEGDVACNIGSGSGISGLLKLWKWDGSIRSARAVFPDSDIGTVVGSAAANTFSGANSFSQPITSKVGAGTAPFSITSTTPVLNLAATPTTYNAAGTQQPNVHLVKDTCTLGIDCSITLTGPAIFTSNRSYDCWARDATTPANAVTVMRTSGSALTFTGTGTDVVNYICLGN